MTTQRSGTPGRIVIVVSTGVTWARICDAAGRAGAAARISSAAAAARSLPRARGIGALPYAARRASASSTGASRSSSRSSSSSVVRAAPSSRFRPQVSSLSAIAAAGFAAML